MRHDFQRRKDEIFCIPLETPHLVLRTLRPRDTGALQKFCAADDASYRRRWDLWNVEITPAAVKRKLRDTYGNSNHLYMFRKGVSDIVGLIELYEDRKGRPRISYFTLPSERGHGYAFEAYKATFNHCVKHGLVEGLFYAHTDPDNIASQHFLRSAGMSCSGSKTIKSPCSKKSCDVDSFSRIVTENTRIRHKIHIP